MVYLFHFMSTYLPTSVLNVKVIIGPFNQEKALVGEGPSPLLWKPMDRLQLSLTPDNTQHR